MKDIFVNPLGRLARCLPLVLCLQVQARQTDFQFDIVADVKTQPTAILKDRDGFIWIGTSIDGVYRFDGKTLKHYPPASGLVPGNSISAICEDREGLLWFFVIGTGLCKYDKNTNRTTVYRNATDDSNGHIADTLREGFNRVMIVDRDGYLWIGTAQGGLIRFDKKAGVFKSYTHDPNDPSSLSSNNVFSILEGHQGHLWIGTDRGVNRFDRSTGRFTHFSAGFETPGGSTHLFIQQIYEDSTDTLWFSTSKNNLYRFDDVSETFTKFRHDSEKPGSLPDSVIFLLFEDMSSTLWISTSSGLVSYDRETERFSRPSDPNPYFMQVLPDPETSSLWAILHDGKIVKHNYIEPHFTTYGPTVDKHGGLSAERVHTIYEDSAGILWICTNNGLNRYDPLNDRFDRYFHEPGNPESIPSTINMTLGLFEDSAGTFWIGSATPGVVSIFDRKRGEIVKTYVHDPTDPSSLPESEQVNYFLEDADDSNILWIASASGLIRFDKASEQFVLFGKVFIWQIHEHEGFLWCGTWGDGLARFDKRAGTFTFYRHDPEDPSSISGNMLMAIHEADENHLWLGTDNGIDRFNMRQGTSQRYVRSDGYPWDAIHSIGEDPGGTLWLGTNAGLARFDPRTLDASVYTSEDGAQDGNFHMLNGIMSQDGRLWFGGSEGMTSFRPETITDDQWIPEIRCTAFKQAGVDVDFGAAPERLSEVTLNWDDNFFEFEFIALDYTAPDKNKYAYMLEGLDQDWYYSGTRNFGRYTAIPPGHYVLRLKGTNHDGVWNESGASIRITVLPPFWKTTWFRALLIVLTFGVIVGVANYIVILNREIRRRKVSEGRNRVLIENASEAIFVFDADDHGVLDVNENAIELFGLDRTTLLNTSVRELSPTRQIDGQSSADAMKEQIQKTIMWENPVFEWQFKDADGETFPCEIRMVRLPSTKSTIIRTSVIDITERKRNELRQKNMMQELDHRVKNTLAMILSLSERTAETADTLDEFRTIFNGRLVSLALTHEALAAQHWIGIDLEEIVRLTIPELLDSSFNRIQVKGEPILLPAEAASPICLTLHELKTNAMKHGALSRPSGEIEIRWILDQDLNVCLNWVERNGPPITEEPVPGFGTSLILGLIEYELRGSVLLNYEKKGLDCTLTIPTTAMEHMRDSR